MNSARANRPFVSVQASRICPLAYRLSGQPNVQVVYGFIDCCRYLVRFVFRCSNSLFTARPGASHRQFWILMLNSRIFDLITDVTQTRRLTSHTLNSINFSGLSHRSARRVSLWSAATRRSMVRKSATSRRTPNLVG